MNRPSRAESFELSSGALCLDFVNTLGDRPRSESERLTTYGDFLRFSHQTDSVPAGDLENLERLVLDCSPCVDAVFRRILEVREATYRIMSRVAVGDSPPEDDLEILNTALKKAMRQTELRYSGGEISWRWGGPAQALDRPLWPIVRSAAELLTSDEKALLRECAAETCSWLFLDRSRSHRRRWCDMSTCGNRAKARRHYQRKKARASSTR
jgi:predicted RNA-binding Zn ribbon-like protein